MYKIEVLTSGKYHNVVPGARYCFRKRTANGLIKNFLMQDCEIEVTKFIRIGKDIYCWSDDHSLYGGLRCENYRQYGAEW